MSLNDDFIKYMNNAADQRQRQIVEGWDRIFLSGIPRAEYKPSMKVRWIGWNRRIRERVARWVCPWAFDSLEFYTSSEWEDW